MEACRTTSRSSWSIRPAGSSSSTRSSKSEMTELQFRFRDAERIEVRGTTPVLPLPTLAISNALGQKDWNFAFGALAPYATLTSYPEANIAFRGRSVPAPQRYSLITLDGSALVVLGAYASYKPSPN